MDADDPVISEDRLGDFIAGECQRLEGMVKDSIRQALAPSVDVAFAYLPLDLSEGSHQCYRCGCSYYSIEAHYCNPAESRAEHSMFRNERLSSQRLRERLNHE